VRDLLKRTPFRLAATFSLFFITTVLALFTVIYLVASARLVSDIRDRVRTNMDSLAVLDGERTFDDLVTVVAEEANRFAILISLSSLSMRMGNFLLATFAAFRSPAIG
jgi:hypothetical protein